MFRKKLLGFVIVLLAITGLAVSSKLLVRFTVINKSGMDIAVQMIGNDSDVFYYLPVPEGSRLIPTLSYFTILRDSYRVQVFYLETYDPVYGFRCGGSAAVELQATHNTRLVVKECGRRSLKTGERNR